MSNILREYHRTVIDDGTRIVQGGSTEYPAGEVTIPNDYIQGPNDFLLMPGQDWEFVRPIEEWSFLKLWIIGTGIVDGWELHDTPTSSTNRVASGAYPRWHSFVLGCVAPYAKAPQVRINPTLATQVGSDGSGKPLAMSDSGTVNGLIYSVILKNRGTTDVLIRRVLAG